MAEVKTQSPVIAPRALTVIDAAAYLGIRRGLLYRLVSEGKISARKNGGRTIFLREELDRYLDQLPQIGGGEAA